MNTKLIEKPKNVKIVEITIEGEPIKKAFDEAINYFKPNITIEGFRKGKAPNNLVRIKIDSEKLNNKVVDIITKDFLPKVIKLHKLKPISNPKLKITKIADTIFEGSLTFVERPEVTLANYKKLATQAYKEAKQEQDKKDEKVKKSIKKQDGKDTKAKKKEQLSEEEHAKIHQFEHALIEKIYDLLIKESKLEIAEELIQDETNRLISSFLGYIQRLGIKFEDYVKQTGSDIKKIQTDYRLQAERNLMVEFLLSEVVKKEEIKVTDAEIKEAIDNTPDASYKKELLKPENKYYIESQLLKQKAVRKLLELSGFKHFH